MRQSTIDAIQAQALQEIAFARTFKQGKIGNWQLNEDLYYARRIKQITSRSSVQLSRTQEFVHTLLSKIDNPLSFKFTKRKNAQTRRVDLTNALRVEDQANDNWDIKDIVGKKQVIIYGRTMFSYYADSINKRYKPHLENVDVYDALIDPACGGVDIEMARNIGDYSVILDKWQLKAGIKESNFIKKNVDLLLLGGGNANDSTQEMTNKISRTNDNLTLSRKEAVDKSKYRFWRWYTWYEGERYYVLMTNSGQIIRCECLPDILPISEEFPHAAWPYWTYAAFPDMTEFWTPSYVDYVRDVFMAEDVTINQTLDNNEAQNKPQKVVNVSAIENLAELKYRRDGIIKVKGDTDVNKAYQTVVTPQIESSLKLFEVLEGIVQSASGVTAEASGNADVNGQVGIYQGNQAAMADRFGLLNKSYAFGYKRFARLWEMGVRDNLIKPVAVEMVGPDGVELVSVKRSDLFKSGDNFGLMVEASNAQTLLSEQLRESKSKALMDELTNPSTVVNREKATELKLDVAGFSADEIDQLLDTSLYGDSDLMSDCDEDLEGLLNGEDVKPNQAANTAYQQRMVDYLQRNSTNISDEQFRTVSAYLTLIEPIAIKNMARQVQLKKTNAMLMAQSAPGAVPSGQPQAPATATPRPTNQ